MSIFSDVCGIAGNIVSIAAAPVKVVASVTKTVTDEVADVVNDIVDDIIE